MRRLLILAALCAGCSSPSPLSPSTSTAAPVVAPVVTPPAPVFPTLSGTWTGTSVHILSAVTPNYSQTSVCDATWNVFSQTGGVFTGDLLLSGSHNGSKCGGGLRLTGSVTVGGIISIESAWPAFDDVTCSLKSTENLHGTASAKATKILQTDSWSCPPFLITRAITIDLSR